MKSKAKAILYPIISLLFWILLWYILSLSLDAKLGIGYIFPTPDRVIAKLFELVVTANFWKSILFSFLRIMLGFALGVILGVAIATLTHSFSLVHSIVSPAMTVVKSTPVASFILLLWLLIGKANVPTVIAVLMVTPIVWQNLTDGYNAVSNSLSEMCEVFEVSRFKRFKLLVFPTVTRFLLPAIITSSALAWKSGIAAEIIVYAKSSIGKEIVDSKNIFDGETVFAWTLVVIILSIAIEFFVKKLLGVIRKV